MMEVGCLPGRHGSGTLGVGGEDSGGDERDEGGGEDGGAHIDGVGGEVVD